MNFCSALFSLKQNYFKAHQIPCVPIALRSYTQFWNLVFVQKPALWMPGAAWRLCFYLSRLCFFSYNSYVLPYSGILYIGQCQYVLCKKCWLIKLKDFMLVQPNCLFNSCSCCNWDYHVNHGHANCFPGTSCNVSCFQKGSCRLLQALLHYPSWGSGKKIEASLYQELYIIRLKVVLS